MSTHFKIDQDPDEKVWVFWAEHTVEGVKHNPPRLRGRGRKFRSEDKALERLSAAIEEEYLLNNALEGAVR